MYYRYLTQGASEVQVLLCTVARISTADQHTQQVVEPDES